MAGTVLTAATLLLLFNPPQGPSSFETLWFGVCIYALFLFLDDRKRFPTKHWDPKLPSITTNASHCSGCGTVFLIAGNPGRRRYPGPAPIAFSGSRMEPRMKEPNSSGCPCFTRRC